MNLVKQKQIQDVCFSLRANELGKGMNPSLLTQPVRQPAIDK